MQKILLVFGTRPEAIKVIPVIRELVRHPAEFETKICLTAQHREMVDQVLMLFDIEPDYNLNIMQDKQALSQVTAKVLTGVEEVIKAENPDWVLVQGDTTTAMAASLAAFYQRVRVAHVEAGLRTWNKTQPYPEELNRVITDVICDLHFAPTEKARDNLLRSGIGPDSIFVTGNTVIDALLATVEKEYNPASGPLRTIPFDKKVLLVTAHRRENFGRPLENICQALLDVAHRYASQVHIVYPVHLNPNVQETVYSRLNEVDNISLLPPLDYLPFVHLMSKSYLVLTDSGGLQEEAPGLGVPVLVSREVTERPEAVEAGMVRVVGTDRETILLLEDRSEYERMARAVNPYGDGRAAIRIVDILGRY